ncbi:SLBB domain-containing protein [Mucilaginibacter lacusdianchii]|uniref:SLBB domain-containing protein n=1 Tax=Mucilaginibacter lacusdianchii TaxID=2684211 RepID=UPI00131BB06C|nr:SLBB domain-containing protein [Mucilaginibacter sp. JXJ CY 39]
MKYRLYLPFLVLFLTVLCFLSTRAQTLNQLDLANINVDQLSDVKIRQLMSDAAAQGLDDISLPQLLRTKGMQPAQIQKLQNRIKLLATRNSRASLDSTATTRRVTGDIDTASNKRDSLTKTTIKVFGSDLFRGSSTTFEPNLRIATPVNYILGPDDQLNINVYGNSLVDWRLVVSPEGTINIPGVGVVNVAGRTVEQATSIIKTRLAANNYAIGRGTNVNVSLGNIRSIKVTVTGEALKPGTYTLPSLATVFNALVAAGGPGENGSFRQIYVIRNNRIIKTLDIYDFILRSDQKDNIALRDQDIIRIPTYKVRVQMNGQIKHPAIFEVLPGEHLKDVIGFAGGFTDEAYTAKVTALQISNQERRIVDVEESDFDNYIPLRGDRYTVDAILNRYENRVAINGAVFRPGDYELEKGLTLSGLIAKAAGLREDAYLQRGYLTRLRPDNTTESIAFDVQAILNKTAADIPLQREDVVNISSIFDLRDQYKVSIKGEVRQPGDFDYAEGLTVEGLIQQAGGLAEGASAKRIQVARRINSADPKAKNSPISEVYSIDISDKLSLASSNFVLKPFDIVSVFTLPGFETLRTVTLEGEVLYPGPYTIKSKDEKISDLIARAGGLTASAYPSGGTLKRTNLAILGIDKNRTDTVALERERIRRLRNLQQNVNGSSVVNEDQIRNDYVGIDLQKIIDKPGSRTDLLLEDGDIIRIPKQQQVVRVNGEVLYPSIVVFDKGKSFKDYVINAGGFSSTAMRRGAYVVYPNGTVKGTRKFLFFNNRPNVKPGSEIFVPRRAERRGISLGDIVGIGGSLTSLVAVVLGLISITK